MDDPKKQQGPRCELKWEVDHFVLECETPEDRDLAARALEENEVVVRVKVRKDAAGEPPSQG